jgi:hypothetical protein
MNAQPRDAHGAYKAQMTGPMLGYFTFAYDLFGSDVGSCWAKMLIEPFSVSNE